MEIKIHDWNIWSCRIDEWSYYISFCNVNSGFIAACTFYFLHICERKTENSKIWLMNWGWWPHPSWSNAQSTSLIKSGNDVEQKRHISSFDKRSRANKWEVELKANHAFGQLWCTPFICFPEVLTNYLVADMKKAHTHTHTNDIFVFSVRSTLLLLLFFLFAGFCMKNRQNRYWCTTPCMCSLWVCKRWSNRTSGAHQTCLALMKNHGMADSV